MDAKEFKDWFSSFGVAIDKQRATKYGLKPLPKVNHIEKWFEECKKAHEKMVESLEGETKTIVCYKVEAQSADPKLIDPYIDAIIKYMPDYLGKYKLTKEDLRWPKLAKCKNISTSKHILTYAERFFKDKPHNIYQYQSIQGWVANMGQIWSTLDDGENPMAITLSCDPRAFVMLGYCVGDTSACFNSTIKYAFGLHKNSIIAIVHNGKDIVFEPSHESIKGRALGILEDDWLGISNRYGQAIYSAKRFENVAKQILKVDNVKVHEQDRNVTPYNSANALYRFKGHVPYTNGDILVMTKPEVEFSIGREYSFPYVS